MASNEMRLVVTGDATSALGVLDQLSKSVKGTTDQVSGAFGGVSKSIENMLAPLAAFTAVLGGGKLFGDAVSQTVDYTKEVSKLSRVLGVSTQEASVFSVALGDVYISADDFLAGAGKMITTLTKNEAAVRGMGIETRNLDGSFKAMPVLISQINGQLSQFTEGTNRDAEAKKIYGKSWQEALRFLALTPKVMMEAADKAEKLNLLVGGDQAMKVAQYRAAMNDVSDTLQGLSIRVGTQVMPVLTSMGNWFQSTGPALVDGVGRSLKALGSILGNTTVQFALMVIAAAKLWAVLASSAMIMSAITTLRLMVMYLFDGAAGMKVLTSAIYANTAAWLTNPIFWIAAAAIAAVAAYDYFSNSTIRAAQAHGELTDTYIKETEALSKNATQIDLMQAVMENSKSTVKQRADAETYLKSQLDELLKVHPELVDSLKAEQTVAENLLRLRGQQRDKDIADGQRKLAELDDLIAKSKALVVEKAKIRWYDWMNPTGQGAQDRIFKELDALKLLNEEYKKLKVTTDALVAGRATGKGAGDGGTPETEIARLKSLLEQKKYLYEKAGMEHAQFVIYSAQQEANFWDGHRNNPKLNGKEKHEVEKYYFEATRKVMLEKHKGEMDALARSTDAYKKDAQKRLSIYMEMEDKAANPEEKKKAQDEQAKVLAEITADRVKAEEIELASATKHSEALLDLQVADLNNRRDQGQISALDYLVEADLLEQKKYEIARKGLEERLFLLVLEGDKTKEAQAKVAADLQALEDKRAATKKGTNTGIQSITGNTVIGESGFAAGLTKSLNESKSAFQQWKEFGENVAKSMESSFSTMFVAMSQKGASFGSTTKAMLYSVRDAVTKGLADMAAAEMKDWVVKQAKSAWAHKDSALQMANKAKEWAFAKAKVAWEWVTDNASLAWAKIKSAFDTAETAKVVAEEGVKTGAKTTTGAAGFWGWFSSLGPWGIPLAIGAIALMMASVKAISGKAEGGPVTGGTPYIVGERGQELFVPSSSGVIVPNHVLANGARNLSGNIASGQAGASNYDHLSSSYAASAQSAASGERSHYYDMRGSVNVDAGSSHWAEIVQKGMKGYGRRNG